MLRHEQQSIRMALATVMHHSFKVHTENGAPRGQTTATRAGGEGDGVLRDVRGLRCGGWGSAAVSCGCAAAGAASAAHREADRRPCAGGPVAPRR